MGGPLLDIFLQPCDSKLADNGCRQYGRGCDDEGVRYRVYSLHSCMRCASMRFLLCMLARSYRCCQCGGEQMCANSRPFFSFQCALLLELAKTVHHHSESDWCNSCMCRCFRIFLFYCGRFTSQS